MSACRYAVIPAQAGIHDVHPCWIPAFAGMTAGEDAQ
jgi:folate-dependent phosphoribosylglycinamide formyltransferase PurN